SRSTAQDDNACDLRSFWTRSRARSMTETLDYQSARRPPLPAGTEEILPLHGDVGVRRFFIMHAIASVFPVVAGIMLYGWRAGLAVMLVIAGTGVGLTVWRRVGKRGRRMGVARAMWMAILLALTLPAHLASSTYPD